MPSYYRAPIDPGYERFGATIANAVGDIRQSIKTQEQQAKEQERYQAEQDRLNHQLALQQDANDFQMAKEGFSRNPPPVNAIVAATTPPAPAPPPGPAPMVVPQDGPAPGLATPTIADAVGGPQASLSAPAPAPAAAPAPEAAAPAAPPVTFTDHLGRTFYLDVSRSQRGQEQALEFQRNLDAKHQHQKEVSDWIAHAMQDGITPQEAAEGKALYGISYEDLQDPEVAVEKAWKHKQREIEFETDQRIREDRVKNEWRLSHIAGGAGGGGPTANRLLTQAEKEVQGQAYMLKQQGLTGPQIMKRLAPYAAKVGGEGNLAVNVRTALDPGHPSPQAIAQASQAVTIDPEKEPEKYSAAVGAIARAIQSSISPDVSLYAPDAPAPTVTPGGTPIRPPAAAAPPVPAGVAGALTPSLPRAAGSAFNLGGVPGDTRTPAQRRADEIRAAKPGISAADIVKQLRKEKLVK